MLPSQVKDVEVAIQEAVTDQLEDLVISQICAAAADVSNANLLGRSGRASNAVSGLLSAIADPGLNARISLEQALAKLMAKGRLKGASAAGGLQHIIKASGMCLRRTH